MNHKRGSLICVMYLNGHIDMMFNRNLSDSLSHHGRQKNRSRHVQEDLWRHASMVQSDETGMVMDDHSLANGRKTKRARVRFLSIR